MSRKQGIYFVKTMTIIAPSTWLWHVLGPRDPQNGHVLCAMVTWHGLSVTWRPFELQQINTCAVSVNLAKLQWVLLKLNDFQIPNAKYIKITLKRKNELFLAWQNNKKRPIDHQKMPTEQKKIKKQNKKAEQDNRKY